MNLFCYSSFYPIAWAGGAARCASTIMSNFQFSIFNFQLFCASTRFPNCQLSILHFQLTYGSPRWRKTNSTWRGVNTRCPSMYPVSVNSFFKDSFRSIQRFKCVVAAFGVLFAKYMAANSFVYNACAFIYTNIIIINKLNKIIQRFLSAWRFVFYPDPAEK